MLTLRNFLRRRCGRGRSDLQCQSCSKPTVVPHPTMQTADAAKTSDLQHQLKENESQRTEITGYINQLSIQLHRWQLRLKSLNERQQKLESELSSLGVPINK